MYSTTVNSICYHHGPTRQGDRMDHSRYCDSAHKSIVFYLSMLMTVSGTVCVIYDLRPAGPSCIATLILLSLIVAICYSRSH
ncbi:hypothetical protein V1515DRAFT_590328 [Lipomyces mesembrius]